MLDEVLAELDPRPGEVVCDCTLGGAGHSVELARRVAPDGLSLGIDQDDMALTAASERLSREVPEASVRLLRGNFGDLDDLLVEAEVPGVDCFLFDLGVSSPQLDIPERGFSYHEDAPLDMRMNSGNHTLTAAEVVNTYNEADLTRILRVYGDERFASRIARRIVERRSKAPVETTLQLVEIVKEAIPAAARRHGGHPARKTFQALRIEVNHELDVLDRGLRAAVPMDDAYCFYYRENIECLEASGFRVETFRPTEGDPLPDADLYYLGGGYPELHAADISANGDFLEGLRSVSAEGRMVIGECGGLMTMCRSITDAQGVTHRMAGILDAESRMTGVRHGPTYVIADAEPSNPSFSGTVRGHEYHYSDVFPAEGARFGFSGTRGQGISSRMDGLLSGNSIGSYMHQHALSERDWIGRAVESILSRS